MAAQFESPLYRDFPSTLKLTREDLEELLSSPRETQSHSQQSSVSGDGASSEAYFEAFVDSLPEVRALFEEHAKLLRENEERACEFSHEGGSIYKQHGYATSEPFSFVPVARNLAMQPQLEALRAETQHYYDRAAAAESEWPRVEAEMKEAYKVSAHRPRHSS